MINLREMLGVLARHRGDAIVLTAPISATYGWMEFTQQPHRDVPGGGALGKGSSVALGLALAQPDTKVIVLDGDGSLEMNLGSMTTIAGKSPVNLYHFVLENGIYATTGGQPIPAQGFVSLRRHGQGGWLRRSLRV